MKHTIYFPKHSCPSSAMLFCIPLTIGMIAGSVWFSGHTGDISPVLHQYFSPQLSGVTVSCVFLESLASSILILLVCFVFGLCAIGQPVAAVLPLYRGFGIGISVSVGYAHGGASALPETLLILVPDVLAASAVTYIAVREAFRTSNALIKALCRGESSEKPLLKMYCIRFSVLLLISAVLASIKALLGYLLSGIV